MSLKYILFIVEGNNDKRELDAILHSSYFVQYKDKYKPVIYVTNGDITASAKVQEKNVVNKINEILIYFRRKGVPYSNISVSDIQEVVQIVDLDGAFIPYENIVCGEDNTFIYEDDAIITSNVDGAYGRNRKKAEILERLIETKEVGGVPYSVYYVSCNMDHVLFNERMPSQGNKNDSSFKFQCMCQENEDILKETMFNDEIIANCSYIESWNIVKEDCESLHRHTNLNLFFSDEAKNVK